MGKEKTNMEKCMHEWKKEHPTGRGKVSDPHEQAVAACLSKTDQSNEGFSFKEYLDTISEDNQ